MDTKRIDQPAGLYQVSDQSNLKQLKNKHFKQGDQPTENLSVELRCRDLKCFSMSILPSVI
jgi:hypothetical protein